MLFTYLPSFMDYLIFAKLTYIYSVKHIYTINALMM